VSWFDDVWDVPVATREACKLSQDYKVSQSALLTSKKQAPDPDGRDELLQQFWLTKSSANWRAWRNSWGEWLSVGVLYGSSGFDVLAVSGHSLPFIPLLCFVGFLMPCPD
jgi:hypothetical protein